MAIKHTQTHVKKIAALLDQEWDSAEEAADALLTEALSILEERGKFTVVGQLYYSPKDGHWLDKDDARAAKVCLGLYSTQGDADKAAYSLTYTAGTGEQWLTWVLPVEHATPAAITKKRSDMHKQRELDEKKKPLAERSA